MAVTATQPVKVELYGANNDGELRRYTIADGTAVSKYDILALTDPRTVIKAASAAAGVGQAMAGIAAEEHVANQGSTSIAVFTNGIFEMQASGAIILGSSVEGRFNNFAGQSSAVSASGAYVLGYALETATDEEVINVRLRL